MIEENIRYIYGKNGNVDEVVLPIGTFRRMVEELEDKELLRMMSEVENNSPHCLSEAESFDLLDQLIDKSEV
jgi:hypothetical protein